MVEAKSRAVRLAEVFFGSNLGRRALAATERYVEMKVAIAMRSDAIERAPGKSGAIGNEQSIGREPTIGGQNELDFGGPAPVRGQSRAGSESPTQGQSRAGSRARGTIDLAFVEDGRVVVVDYKTDSMIATGEHDLQVAAYKRAASEIFGLPAEAWVFYLYGGGRAIRVDADGRAPRLEDAPEAPPSPEPSFSRPTNKDISP